MKKCFLILVCFFSSTLMAQNEAEMKAWNDYMTPGEMHQWFANSEGKWKYVQESWMAPGTAAIVDSGISTHTMILGGRYLQVIHEGSAFGTPFTGINILGYDNSLKKFFSIWLDNLGTGYTIATGDFDKTTNSISLMGNMFDPLSGKDWKYKMVMMEAKTGKVANEMYGFNPEGKEYLMMRSVYTKAD
jgi:hypothetical protein